MIRWIVAKRREFINWKRIVWDDKSRYTLPFFEKYKYALRGFSVFEYFTYHLDKNDYREYISEYERLKGRDINGKYKFVLDDKLIFEEVFGQYVNVPRNYAWIKDGIVYGLHRNGMNNDNLLDFLAKYGKTVLKWNDRGGGSGTFVIFFREGQFIVNGKMMEGSEVEKLFDRKGSAILCQYITQSEFSSSLYPNTTNTIRIVCAKKKGADRAEFVAAAQRVGCDASIPVDNASRGGFIVSINSETGELGMAVAKKGGDDRALKPFENHPDTGDQIKGKIIPGWSGIVETIVELTNVLPYLNFVAWDILLTDDGFYVIEGNASSGTALFQLEEGAKHKPLGEVLNSYGIFNN